MVYQRESSNVCFKDVNARHESFLNKVTGCWNELGNWHINAININSFKACIDNLPILAAIAYQAQSVQRTAPYYILITRFL